MGLDGCDSGISRPLPETPSEEAAPQSCALAQTLGAPLGARLAHFKLTLGAQAQPGASQRASEQAAAREPAGSQPVAGGRPNRTTGPAASTLFL